MNACRVNSNTHNKKKSALIRFPCFLYLIFVDNFFPFMSLFFIFFLSILLFTYAVIPCSSFFLVRRCKVCFFIERDAGHEALLHKTLRSSTSTRQNNYKISTLLEIKRNLRSVQTEPGLKLRRFYSFCGKLTLVNGL